jgi:hypothetical protein
MIKYKKEKGKSYFKPVKTWFSKIFGDKDQVNYEKELMLPKEEFIDKFLKYE